MRKYAVIPAFSEEETIASVVENLISYVDHVVVIDDCSYDQTRERASAAGAEVLINDRNLGYEKSLFKGIQHAINGLASSVLTFDADGQHPYEIIPKMFDLIEFQSADVVVGCRSSLPRFSEKLFSAYTRYRFGIPDILSGLKCYSAKVLVDVNPNPAWDSIGSRIALKAALNGCDVVSLPISCNDRSCGISRFGASMRAEWRILYAFLRSLHL